MDAKRFRKNFKSREKTSPPVITPTADGSISRSEAVAFLAEHCMPSHEEPRAFKNKVGGRVRDAVRRNKLKEVDGGFVFGDLMAWAKNVPDWADGLSTFPHNNIAHINAILPSMFGQAQAHCLPVSIDACHQRIIELETRNSSLEARIEELLPFAAIGLKMRRPKKKP